MMKSIIIGSFLFFLSFLALAGQFLETFEDTNLKEWREIILQDGAPGSWEIVDGKLQGISHGGNTRLLSVGDKTWRDYEIAVEVKPQKKHGPGNIAIAARIRGTSAIVCVIGDMPVLEPKSRAICFGGNLHNDKTLSLGAKLSPFLRLNKWSTLKLQVQGNTLIFWINGKQILGPLEIPELQVVQRIDPEFPSLLIGGAGIGLTNYTADFDNIIITGKSIPNKGGLSVSPEGQLATMWASLKWF
ncbi:MAG: DUF1080 domain-containing protein [Candidatus Poribacteria bacterium]|nr:DUF1080 domain-containing protein [Candidatus Poribacteria bacterium]